MMLYLDSSSKPLGRITGKEVTQLLLVSHHHPPCSKALGEAGNTCVVMSELADLPELIPVGAEPVNDVVVVGEDAEALVHHVA